MTQTQTCDRVTFGALRRRAEAGDFLLTESAYPPGLRTAPHAHDVTSLVFGLSGELEQSHGSRTGALLPHTMLVLPRGVVHSDQVGQDGCACLFVSLGGDKLEAIQRYTPVLESVRFSSGGHISLLARALYHESWCQDSVSPLAVEGLVYQLLARLAREPGPGDERTAPWLASLRDRLESEFAHPPALAELAREAGLHPAYLARAFARKFGISVSGFIRVRRIEWAMDQLRHSKEPVAEIAVAAGFFDQSHFTRCFKRTVGTTPARFRQHYGWSTG
jgi:AraC family transcriptional regulator